MIYYVIYAAIHIAVRTSVQTLLLLVGIVYVPFVNGKTPMDRLLWIDRPQCVHYPNLNTPAGAHTKLQEYSDETTSI